LVVLVQSNKNIPIDMLRVRSKILFILLFIQQVVFSQNSVTNVGGIADPHVHVFNDTIYLYSGHDSHPDDKTWVMKDWRVFSTNNLLDWKQETTISPKDNYMVDNSADCWAADAATRNGKYFFYFSDRKRGIGVMQSDSPGGVFTDALGKPLVSPMHDPTILIDDDKKNTPYLIYGDKEGGGFHIAKLKKNMIEVVHKPKPIEIIGAEWENAPQWMDKNYIFKRNGIYYLTWGRDYAISENIYGPYQCMGAVGNGHHLNEFAHGSFFEWKGQFYHIWCYYIRPGYKYRALNLTYCHFDNEGRIVTDTKFLDEHFENGVGSYKTSWKKIEAEWFYEKSQELKKQSNDVVFEVSKIVDGSWLRFANVDFEDVLSNFSAKLRGGGKYSKIEITLDNPDGEIIGAVSFPGTQQYATVNCKVKNIFGKHDVYLKFTGIEEPNLAIDNFWFSK
jgi:hypothetical protein